MGKFSTLATGVSGLYAAQAGLYVTGHNMSNSDTVGFTRQRTIQGDFMSVNVGTNGRGLMQVGLGTDVQGIFQIRDRFLDISYRAQAGKHDFYYAKAVTGTEIENILGELQSQYSTDTVLKDVWDALNELSVDPSSISARGSFVSTAIIFMDKVNNIYTRLFEYQRNLNDQVKDTVQQINRLIIDIDKYNGLIMQNEISGDHANDYRDLRNSCLDELSHLIDISYTERANGRVDIMAGGNELLVNGVINKIGLRYTSPDYSFVEPVFTSNSGILSWDEKAKPLFSMTGPVSANMGNDKGRLWGLLVSRGLYPANYTSPTVSSSLNPSFQEQREIFNTTQCMIPKVMRELDTLVNAIVTMINDAVAPYDKSTHQMDPNAPYDLEYNNKGGFEIFVRKYVPRFDPATGLYNVENSSNPYSLYSIGNIEINPLLLESSGYNLIALMTSASPSDAPEGESDNSIVLQELLNNWKGKNVFFGTGVPMSVDDAYRHFITNIATETNEALNYVDQQQVLLQQIDGKRSAISGVSLDEEMRNMMVYQHAYNAAARVINTVDSMIDKIVNGTGRVGR